MLRFGRFIAGHRKKILIIGFLLLIPAIAGYLSTGVNYNILTYLPEDIETVQGENILMDEFGKGGFAMVMTEGMSKAEVSRLTEEISQIDHVSSVIGVDSLTDGTIPTEIVPGSLAEKFQKDDTQLMAVFFDTSISDDGSLEALAKMRRLGGKHCFISGMTAFVLDLKELAEAEEPIYVGIAVLLSVIVMALFMDSWFVALVFILSIGIAIIYNMGSNIFMGEISYITKALSAVLQLAVTMDYSIFLWHSYEEERDLREDRKEAMAHAIKNTLTSVAGSSITTIAGFLALCFMTFTLGLDLGIVMAKGVLLGVICSVSLLPALILCCERPINGTRHRPLMPSFDRITRLVTKRPAVLMVIFIVLVIPAFFGYTHTSVYYKLDEGVPQTLPFKVAGNKLAEDFNMSTTHFVLLDADTGSADIARMTDEINDVEGVSYTLGLDSALGGIVPTEVLPTNLLGEVENDKYKMLLIGSEYEVASDKVNTQCDRINEILDKYDKGAMLFGEAPCTKDLISITDRDFRIVTFVSIGAIFLIILLVLRSISLPVILVGVIELAIFINLGIPCFTGQVLSFIDSICISTIQLGATVDYAILMTTRYKRERAGGCSALEAVQTAHGTCMPSITVSALGFFAATFGVSVYSNIDIISSMCGLMCRGAIVSWLSVMFILPAALLVFDKVIRKTSRGFSLNSETKAQS